MAVNYELLKTQYKTIITEALPLQDSDLVEIKCKQCCKTESDIKSPLDQAFRDIVQEMLEKQCSVYDLQNVVLLCIEMCRKNLTTPTIPVVLLGDIFDALTLDVCEDMFTFVEREVLVWKENLFFTSCKNNLLRMCNDLLRRLSRSSATVFCGRILLFLAKFFPFSERSGLNIVSEFNLENVTLYRAEASEDPVTQIEVDGSKRNIMIDYSLYCKFWSLQDFFRNPNQCYNKVQWKLFCSHANSILSTFQGLKLDYTCKDLKMGEAKEATPYFPKYLTNQKLLDLQIYDVNFRRSVLLQFLILFQYLTCNVKFKSETFELKNDQKEWVQSVTEKVYSLLQETPPDGERFAQIVKNILEREEHWNLWKNDGCPEFKKMMAPTETTTTPDPKQRSSKPEKPFLGDLIKEASHSGKYYMGSPELTKLWNLSPNNLEACKAKDRDFLPSLEGYFSDAINQLESQTVIKEDEKLLRDPNYGWRALRLMARRSPHFFTYNNNPINQLPDYLEMIVRKIAADRPGRNPTQEHNEQNDVELEADLFKVDPPSEDLKPGETEEDMEDPASTTNNVTALVTSQQLEKMSQVVGEEWKKLAAKLGFQPDEIKFFDDVNPSVSEKAKNMLQLWFEDDVDANLENLAYILEGLAMTEAADIVKNEIESSINK